MKLLEQMYRKEAFSSFNDTRKWGGHYQELMSEIVALEAEMLEKFPDIQPLLNRFQDIQAAINSITMYHEFETGFRVGAKLMAEIMKDIDD